MKLRILRSPARRSGRQLVVATTALIGLAALPMLVAGPASAATAHATAHAAAHATQSSRQAAAAQHSLTGTTTVTTAPGIAAALVGAGVLPLPTAGTRVGVPSFAPLKVSYGFPITGGHPDLSGPTGDILHSGGINFVSRGARLEIGRFDIDLAAGKIFARQVNFAAARIPVLDVDLKHVKVSSSGGNTVLSGIVLRLDPVAAGALNATFGLKLPTDGSLVFGTGRITLRG